MAETNEALFVELACALLFFCHSPCCIPKQLAPYYYELVHISCNCHCNAVLCVVNHNTLLLLKFFFNEILLAYTQRGSMQKIIFRAVALNSYQSLCRDYDLAKTYRYST